MPTEDYLDSTGLAYYHNRIKNLFADKESLEALEDRVDGIVAEGGEPNVIDTVKVNGTALPVVNKAVDVTVPTQTSQLTNNGDGTSNFATESYVNQNGGKIDKIILNGTEQTITNKTVSLTTPNAFSNIAVGQTTIQADNTTDTLTVIAGDHITLTPNANNDSLTIASSYSNASGSADGLMSSSDYTKLQGIASGAQANVIESVKVNGTALQIVNKAVDVTVPTNLSQLTNDGDGTQGSEYATKAYVASQLTSVYTYKGSVATYADLPASGMQVGDVYDVVASGMNYAWTGTSWDALGTYVDTSLYWAKSELVAITTAQIDTIVGA